jgi:small subunit ribosomal protein S3Ae
LRSISGGKAKLRERTIQQAALNELEASTEVSTSDVKEFVNKLIPDSIGKDIEKVCQGIYPLHDVYIPKSSV